MCHLILLRPPAAADGGLIRRLVSENHKASTDNTVQAATVLSRARGGSAVGFADAQFVCALGDHVVDRSQEAVDEVALPLRVPCQQLVQLSAQLPEHDAAVLSGLCRGLHHDPAAVVLVVGSPCVACALQAVRNSGDGAGSQLQPSGELARRQTLLHVDDVQRPDVGAVQAGMWRRRVGQGVEAGGQLPEQVDRHLMATVISFLFPHYCGRITLQTRNSYMLREIYGFAESDSRHDVGQVREALWEVAEELVAAWLVLLREETQIVARGRGSVEQVASLCQLTLLGQTLGEPERAGQEASFPLWAQPVGGRHIGPVAQQKTVYKELLADLADRVDGAGIVVRAEPGARDEQEGGVHGRDPVGLHEAVAVPVDTACLDRLPYLPGDPLPTGQRRLPHALLRESNPTVDSGPAHHLRVDEVLGVAPDLPDATIRLLPALASNVDQVDQEAPVIVVRGVPPPVPGPGQVQ